MIRLKSAQVFHPAVLVGGLLLFLFLGLLVPGVEPPEEMPVKQQWNPSIVRFGGETSAILETISESRRWDLVLETASSKATGFDKFREAYVLTAILQGSTKIAVFSAKSTTEGEQTMRLKQGDTIKEYNALLESLSNTSVVFEVDGESAEIQLYEPVE